MSWEIKHRLTGKVILSGVGNLRVADLTGADLRDADLTDADLRDADLRVADLRDADLRDADLRGAYLRGADLRGAYLRGADLRGAYLRDADLRGAYLTGTTVIGLGQRSDGHHFFLQLREGQEPLVLAGCRYMPMTEAREHWVKTRGGTRLGDESQAMLDHGERLMKIRGES